MPFFLSVCVCGLTFLSLLPRKRKHTTLFFFSFSLALSLIKGPTPSSPRLCLGSSRGCLWGLTEKEDLVTKGFSAASGQKDSRRGTKRGDEPGEGRREEEKEEKKTGH